ncbi:syndecan-like [Teleopsis dalmanni]|uniref:syndecan-like n=1 Tax=Teleopsis dalmanni TaxID=139649 RepID=UPI0018CC9ACA|nr:syndecan-like [Teleopsis dalmanni]
MITNIMRRLHDDLEKDPDYSGSGFGPDDEDSSTDHHHRRPSIHTQTGISKQNTNDNDYSTSRTHQTNSGTIIGSGTSGNSGIISGSGNTGINTIDDDDFDLDETIGGGSGDGGIIDHGDNDDDDDHTGDIDNDDGEEIIEHDNHHIDIDAAAGGGNKLNEKEHIDPYEHSTTDDRKATNNLDEDDTVGNYDENEETIQVHREKIDNDDEDDEGTEIYTDVTDPNNDSNGGSAQTRQWLLIYPEPYANTYGTQLSFK